MRHAHTRCDRLLRVVLCALAVVLGACTRDPGPPLLEVDEVAPMQLEALDRLEIQGKGFPQGHRAHVTFRGRLHRPGVAPETAVIEAEGAVDGPDLVQLVMTEALVERFCGASGSAAHTTFHGSVEVGFASRVAGAPPLVGSKSDVELDLHPASRRADALARLTDEGTRLAAFAGLVVGPAGAHGLAIEGVVPGSPAEARGLVAGDVLVAVDGVRAHELADVVSSSPRAVTFTVRHATGATEEYPLSLAGFAKTSLSPELTWVSALVLLALAGVILLVTPGPRWLARAEQRLGARLRGQRARDTFDLVLGRGRTRAVVLVASAAISFALASERADESACALVVLAFALLLLSREPAGRSRGPSIVLTLQLLPLVLVLPVALLGVALVEGSVHLGELVALQSGAPWHIEVARRPLAALLGAAFVVALVVVVRTRPRIAARPDVVLAGVADEPRSDRRALAERLGLFAASAVGAVAFLGGPTVSGVVGVALLFVKAWLVVAGVLLAGRIATPWSGRTALAFALTRLLPALLVVLAAVFAERRVTAIQETERALGALACGVALVMLARAVVRVRGGLARPQVHASPFL